MFHSSSRTYFSQTALRHSLSSSDLRAIGELMDKKLGCFRRETNANFKSVNENLLRLLRRGFPREALPPYHLVQNGDPLTSAAHGASSTWSYCRTSGRSSKVYVAGAAHCALFYPSWHFTPLYVPARIAPWVVAVWAHPQLRSIPEFPARDSILLELSKTPGALNHQKLPILLSSSDAQKYVAKNVVGASPSIYVEGRYLMWYNDHFLFHEDAGEPGNSGTLMHPIDTPKKMPSERITEFLAPKVPCGQEGSSSPLLMFALRGAPSLCRASNPSL